MGIKIGCCGFPVKKREYAALFRVVEVQQTFYQPPQVTTAQRWREEMPPDFEFLLKAWQLITHEAKSPTYRRLRRPLKPEEQGQVGSFKNTPVVHRAWEATREMAQILLARCVLFQCPASFTPTQENLANLRHFFREVERDGCRFAWESRGAWPQDLMAELCLELGLIPAGDPFTTQSFPGSTAYFRLHGKGGYRYTFTSEDFQDLAGFLSEFEEAYVLFNNLTMWDDARRFARFVGKTV